MKRNTSNSILLGLIGIIIITSCSPLDGTEMAKEVCKCTEEANLLPKSNSTRWQEMEDCINLMDSYELKLEENEVEKNKFDNYFPCLDTLTM